jgi:hypothetical protein
MTDFDLRHHIQAILAETTEENLDTLTELIFEKTARKDVREAYRQALPVIIRNELARAPRPDHGSGGGDQFAGATQDAPAPSVGTTHIAGTGTVDYRQGLATSRVARFRRNNFRITVWVGEKTYRHILDCTRADLEHAAAQSHEKAEANLRAAERYEKLLKVMTDNGAEKVSDLTDEQICSVFGDCDE